MEEIVNLMILVSPVLTQEITGTGITEMFTRDQLEVFGAFSLVITALLWFIGYLILQVRSYKKLWEEEADYSKALAEAEAERSRMAIQTMEKVRATMKEQIEISKEQSEIFQRELEDLRDKKENT